MFKLKLTRMFTTFFIFSLLFFSFYPQTIYTLDYSLGTNNFIGNYIETVNYIHSNSEEGSVILAPPCNFINRVLPYYGNRYIFCGNYHPTDKCEQNIITIGGSTKFRVFAFNLDERNNLAYRFYDNMTEKNLKNITDYYKVDYFLLQSNQYERVEVLEDRNIVKEVGESKGYILFKILKK